LKSVRKLNTKHTTTRGDREGGGEREGKNGGKGGVSWNIERYTLAGVWEGGRQSLQGRMGPVKGTGHAGGREERGDP